MGGFFMNKKTIALFLAVVLAFTTTAFGFTASAVDPDESYDTFDEFTLSDLGLNPGNFENSISAGGYSYTGNSSSHSVVVKFQWEPNLDETDDKGWLIVLDFDYNYRAGVWFRGRDIRFCYNSEKTDPYQKLSSFTSGRHSVEFGRKLVVSGSNQGKYYVYLTVDGELLAGGYTDEYSAAGYNSGNGMQNKIYFNGNLLGNQRFADVEAPVINNGYDEIGYGDLLYGGNPLADETTMGSKLFTYNRTSTTGSAVLKYRWKAKVGSKFQICFDPISGPSMGYMFGAQLYVPESDYPNGYVWLRPGYGPKVALARPIEDGDVFDVEFGRTKIESGANAGKYYIYIKIGDILFAEDYVDGSVVAANGDYTTNPGSAVCNVLSGEIYLTFWGVSGNKITASPVAETYEAYDEIGYTDLLYGGNPLADETTMGSKLFTYNRTSTTGSAVLKYRWKAKVGSKFQICFDPISGPSMGYMFGAQLYVPESDYPNGYVWLRPGYGPKVGFSRPIEDGDVLDVEFARLKVKTGDNAGKYHIYLKIGDILFAEDYVSAGVVAQNGDYTTKPGDAVCNALSGEIYLTFWNVSGNKITYVPFAETYEPYDEIDYTGLMGSDGKPLKENTDYSGATIFTYNRTSPTGSAILKYRWTVGSVPKFQLSFDHAYESNGTTKSMDYMFGVQVSAPTAEYPNGELRLRPGYGKRLTFSEPFEVESIYDIEFARLKVANGPNKGKYYVYFKVDGVMLDESYTDADIVDSNNRYITRPGLDGTTEVTISNKIYLAFWGSTNNRLSATWDTGKGYYVNYYANGNLVEKVPFTFDDPTVEGREPAVPSIPNASGVWENHQTSGLTKGFNVNAVYTVTVPAAAGAAITLNNFGGATVDLKTDIINDYLALTPAQQSDYVHNYSTSLNGYQDHQNISFSWSASGSDNSYTAYFADNPDFDNAFIISTANTALVNKVGIFVPGKTYYWFVAGNDSGKYSAVDTFTAGEDPLRYITAGTVINMRDEGGYMTDSGRKIKYGFVYRGASLDEETSFVDDTAYHIFRYLGMKSEIELRGGYAHTKTGWDNTNSNVYHINAVYYSEILSLDAEIKAQYKATFEAMADRSNYPFYFHCSAGADRTGTFAYLLNGFLGVSLEELREDYELTSFSKFGRRSADDWTNGNSFDRMHSELMAQYGDGSGNISAAIENFLMQNIGVSKSTLNLIKEIMLDYDPMDLDCDGVVNARDMVLLRTALLSDVIDTKFDINADVVIDIRDLIHMKKYLAGLISKV